MIRIETELPSAPVPVAYVDHELQQPQPPAFFWQHDWHSIVQPTNFEQAQQINSRTNERASQQLWGMRLK